MSSCVCDCLIQVTFIEGREKKSNFTVFGIIDAAAGNWPSESFMELFRIAKKCLDPNYDTRPEMAVDQMPVDQMAVDQMLDTSKYGVSFSFYTGYYAQINHNCCFLGL